MMVNDREAHFRLIGEFNAYNLLAVYGAAICLGEEKEEILRNLSGLSGAEGRFDYIAFAERKDYGYCGLCRIRRMRWKMCLVPCANYGKAMSASSRLWDAVVTGTRTKRPIMGEVACQLSDQVVFTSDNPRAKKRMRF